MCMRRAEEGRELTFVSRAGLDSGMPFSSRNVLCGSCRDGGQRSAAENASEAMSQRTPACGHRRSAPSLLQQRSPILVSTFHVWGGGSGWGGGGGGGW